MTSIQENENTITVETTVHADLHKVWDFWTAPEHIMNWNFASADWECPKATNDVTVGGMFSFTMTAKDGSASFDFNGAYTNVVPYSEIAYTMEDGRKAEIFFMEKADGVHMVETFEMEHENPRDIQQAGWQAILENFKKYVEVN